MNALTRRNVLKLLGLASAGYATSSLGRKIALADNAVPKRIVFFYTCHGTLKQANADGSLKPFWAPAAPGAPDPMTITAPWSTASFTLSDIHQALAPYQSSLLFLDGIDMVSAWADLSASDGAHTAGRTHSLIGSPRQSATIAGGISLDQHIASGINSPTPQTVLPSLQLACTVSWNDIDASQDTPVYAGAGQPITLPGSPKDVYGRMLPNGPVNQDPQQIAKMLAQQRSVLDHVQADFTKLSGKLGALDKQRIDAHAAAVRDLEKRIAITPAACVEPDTSIYDTLQNQDTADAFNKTADVMLRLTQVALACDLTRVVTVLLDEAPPDCFGFKQVGDATYFHTMVHETNGVVGQMPLGDDPTALGIVKAYHNYNCSQFVRLLDLLAQTPEPDGTSLLDNTLVVWCGELGGGDHSLDHIPYLLAGKMGGAVSPGRYVRFPRKPSTLDPCNSEICAKTQGPAHNDFLAALATMMGVPTTKFGNPSIATGPLGGWAT
jgi:hypothetical protein